MAVPDGLPMRLPPSPEQRKKTLTRSGLAAGRSRDLKPIPRGAGVQTQPADDPDPDVIVGDTGGQVGAAVAISYTGGTGADSSATGVEAVAIGLGSDAAGRKAVSIGSGSSAAGANGIAIGDNTSAAAQDTIAIGNGVSAPNAYDCVIGTSQANVQINGALIIADQSTGNLYRLDMTGGVLTVVAFP